MNATPAPPPAASQGHSRHRQYRLRLPADPKRRAISVEELQFQIPVEDGFRHRAGQQAVFHFQNVRMVAVKPAGHGNRPGYGREAAGHEVAFRPVGPHRLNELACTIRQTRLVKGLFDQACRQRGEGRHVRRGRLRNPVHPAWRAPIGRMAEDSPAISAMSSSDSR